MSNKYWTDKTDDVDKIAAKDFNNAFDGLAKDIELGTEGLTSHKAAEVLDHPDGSVTTEKIADGVVTINKLSNDITAELNKIPPLENNVLAELENGIYTRTYQLFDKNNTDLIIEANISNGQLIGSSSTRTAIMPCDGNETYTFSLPTSLYHRWIIVAFESMPQIGDTAPNPCLYKKTTGLHSWTYSYGVTSINGRDYATLKTIDSAKYLAIYFYHSNYDSDLQALLDGLMVTKGSEFLDYAPYKQEIELKETVEFQKNITVKLGDEFITSDATIQSDSGWSGSNSTGYAHTSTSTSIDLIFEKATESGSVYLLEFDVNDKNEEFATIGIGNIYGNRAYNGKNHIVMPLLSDGGNLYIRPIADKTFTITNISLKKIQDSGTDKEIEVTNVITDNHTKNYGYRNILFGENACTNAVGSTRTIAIGKNALGSLVGGHRNIALGGYALSQMVGGEENTSIGADSMIYVQGGDENIAIGTASMAYGNNLKSNISIGRNAMAGANTSNAQNNVMIGKDCGRQTTGSGNTYVGMSAGYTNKTGNNNVGIGYWSNGNSGGNNNIHLGTYAGYNDGCSDTIAIGQSAKATKSGQTVIGGKNTIETILKGDLIVQATDGTKKQIVCNSDGTCSWITVN